jgi:hypothetical protein
MRLSCNALACNQDISPDNVNSSAAINILERFLVDPQEFIGHNDNSVVDLEEGVPPPFAQNLQININKTQDLRPQMGEIFAVSGSPITLLPLPHRNF